MVYTLEQLRSLVAPVAEKYRLKAVYIFGSYARGEATEESDVDILVDREGSLVHSLFQMGGLYGDLEDAVKKKIDLVTTQTLEQKRTKLNSPRFVSTLMTERRMIYDRQRSISS